MAGFERFSSGIQYSEHKTILSEKNKNADGRGAFARGSYVRFEIDAPKNTVSASMIMISDDDGSTREFTLAKFGDRYRFTLDTGTICGLDGGLFFYKYRINTSDGAYDMIKNELDGSEIITDKTDSFVGAFQLLIYIRRKTYPKWMHGGVMYQIFPDRFCKGGDLAPRADAKMQDPREIPEFAENGQPILNNNFFGGDLAGIESKLDYLLSLGVNVIYLNPIFEAYSNHRYDTGNYMKIDDMLGGEKAFLSLIKAAKKRGIRVILDGVFNHTGSDSVYFNRYGKYDSVGAYQSENSPYFAWYNFKKFPDKYECWWDFATLPRVRCDEPSYRKFICGKDGVIRKYIKAGVSGWRLDVADEVSDGFLKELKSAAASERRDSVIIGEVWEDASSKVSYGKRREYFRGKELDSVMNYPIRTAVIEYLRNGNYLGFLAALRKIYGNYPPENANLLMNLLGTHDTSRILTALAGQDGKGKTKKYLSQIKLGAAERERGVKLLKIAYVIISTLPGVPCIYYGDEVGMEGYDDPLCRGFYPWGSEDKELSEFFALVGNMRRNEKIFREGALKFRFADNKIACFERISKSHTLVTIANRSDKTYEFASEYASELLFGNSGKMIDIPPLSAAVIKIKHSENYIVSEKIEDPRG